MNKKKIAKILGYVMVAMLSFALMGCGSQKDEGVGAAAESTVAASVEESKAEDTKAASDAQASQAGEAQVKDTHPESTPATVNAIAGTYVATVELKDYMKEADLKQLEAQGAEALGDVPMSFRLDLKADDTFLLDVDTEQLKQDMMAAFAVSVDQIFRKQFTENGIKEDQFDKVAQAAGYDSYEAMKETSLKQLETMTNSLLAAQLKGTNVEGTYSVDGNQVKMKANGLAAGSDTAEILEDDSLKISFESDGQKIELVFKKNS